MPGKYICIFFVFLVRKVFREKIRNISYSFFPYYFETSVFHFILYPVVSSIDMLSFSVMNRVISYANSAFVVAFMLRCTLWVANSFQNVSAVNSSFDDFVPGVAKARKILSLLVQLST